MANLKLKNPSGGSLNLVSADSASDLTVTFPAVTGTAMVSGNMPAFSAYQSTRQTGISGSTFTKVNLQTETFDTNNCFDTSTSTFTPNVAGYYQINATVWGNPGSATIQVAFASLFKNGTWYADGSFHSSIGNTQSEFGCHVSSLVYFNGTTDYIQLYVYSSISSGTLSLEPSNVSQRVHMSGTLVRAA